MIDDNEGAINAFNKLIHADLKKNNKHCHNNNDNHNDATDSDNDDESTNKRINNKKLITVVDSNHNSNKPNIKKQTYNTILRLPIICVCTD